ncbi:hypothetical protein GFK88_11155 [Roseibium aggregatum]|nr:hypothetical protein GFK88_11155 [Roseibium aggregatum]
MTFDGSEWLVDAGFGGQAPAEPVRISEERQQIRDQVYRIRFEAMSGEHVLERQTEEGWFALYGFDRVDVRPVDIEAANFLCAASPRQSFAGSMKFYRLTDRGFISFLDGRARFVGGGNKREWLIEEAEDLGRFMRNDLGLGYDDDTVHAIALRLQDMHRLD